MSRLLIDLDLNTRTLCQLHIKACHAAGIDLLITCTYRSAEEQAALYAKGRTAPGKIVTNAPPGRSTHERRVAYDVVPLLHGKPVWNDAALWKQVGELGEQYGLHWSGRWKGKLRETAHFQSV